ncbi:hypothetical protein HDV02_004941 [Globomyces sp. JEL0801]|nr:hypothetical protein HDV02_004941 [Globomyces sp. JEL0801]
MDPLTYESQWIKCITQKQRKFVTNLDKRLNYCATISHALPYLNSSYELDNNFDAPIDVNEWRIQEQNYVETIIVIGGFLLCLVGVTFYLLRMRFKVETQKPIKPWKRPLSDEITQRYLNDQLFSITVQNSRSLLNSEQQELDEVIVETVSLNWDDLPGDNDFPESVGDTGGYYIDPSSSESLVFVEDPNAQHTKY